MIVLGAARDLVAAWTWVALFYTLALQTVSVSMGLVSLRNLRMLRPARRASRRREVVQAALPEGVSIVMPCHNESAVVVEAVWAMLGISYPLFEVVVVNDGSTDDTLSRLVEEFGLLPVQTGPRPYPELVTDDVVAVWVPATGGLPGQRSHLPLRVIDKVAGGSKAKAANVGVAAAIHPYVVVCDGDSLIDPDTISSSMAEAVGADRVVLGVGATVLPVNDSVVEHGRVVEARVPRNPFAAIQLAEYLRAFVVGRSAFSRMGASSIISGAYGLFRRSDLLAVGGYAEGHLGEDFDLTVRLHRFARDRGLPYHVLQVPEALLWTEVPESRQVLKRQRVRWHRGLHSTMRDHRDTLLRPRYGRFGSIGMLYMLLFEYLAPIIEGTGYVVFAAALILGIVNVPIALLLIGITLVAGFANTVVAIVLEELHLGHYRRTSDLVRLLLAGVVEQFGYRQLTLIWRLRALTTHRTSAAWGAMPRKGFTHAPEPAAASAA